MDGVQDLDRCWGTEQTGHPNEMSEMALAHTVSDAVETAYRRGDRLEKPRRMIADWGGSAPTGRLRRVMVPLRT
ncbi:protein of unknown function [Bradyrhizobium vignae]|uniref:Uncharacterized protein n=1 Tax=Bradyrhizobium vignae TaxID=1549949 RepID=A0A2U3QAD2_9BRAD|nr:protein of unknown function [Bradyrhizobium vignae]